MDHVRWTLLALLAGAPLACVHEQDEEDHARASVTAVNGARQPANTTETASFVTERKETATSSAPNDCAPLATGGTSSGSAGRNGGGRAGGRDDHNTQ
jgi:hypothetical protein